MTDKIVTKKVLFNTATPNGTLRYSNISLTDFKYTLDHITLLCCANMSRTDKKKFVIKN